MDWKEEFEQKLNNGEITTDSQIEDFIDEKTDGDIFIANLFADSVWKAYYKWRAKGTPCEGCKNIWLHGLYPCTECSRMVETKDHYEKQED